jgi:hypothetical protein
VVHGCLHQNIFAPPFIPLPLWHSVYQFTRRHLIHEQLCQSVEKETSAAIRAQLSRINRSWGSCKPWAWRQSKRLTGKVIPRIDRKTESALTNLDGEVSSKASLKIKVVE